MTTLRGVLAIVGIAAVGVGLLFVASPSLAGVLGVPEAALTLLGAIAFVEGIRSVRARRRAEIDQATPPDPEARLEMPMPGADFDRSVGLGRMGGARVRRRLREAAVETISIRRGVADDDAEVRVDAGTWTDDPVAASFLGGPDVPPLPWRLRLRFLLDQHGLYRFAVARTVDALADVWEEE